MPTGSVPPQGDAVCWETLVKKLHSHKFSWPNASLWHLMQPRLYSQKGSHWKWFGPPTDAFDLMYVATQVSPSLPEGHNLLRARDAAQDSVPHCAGSNAWGRGEGCRPQLLSTAMLRTSFRVHHILQVHLGELRGCILSKKPL